MNTPIYVVVKLPNGSFAVQNTQTYQLVWGGPNEAEAKQVAEEHNRKNVKKTT